jgi:hypothetical protein
MINPEGEPGSGGPAAGYNLTVIVMTAGAADMVRPLKFTAILALNRGCGFQSVVGATHVAARLRGLFLRYSHGTI